MEDLFAHSGVQGRQWVVQQVNITIAVNSSGQIYSLFLSTTKVCPSFSNLRRRFQCYNIHLNELLKAIFFKKEYSFM